MNQAVKIKGKPEKLSAAGAQEGSLREKKDKVSPISFVVPSGASDFLVHKKESCFLYTADRLVKCIAKKDCAYCKHPPHQCPTPQQNCYYCSRKTHIKILNFPAEECEKDIVEFRTAQGCPIYWYTASRLTPLVDIVIHGLHALID